MIKEIMNDDYELVSIYYGDNVSEEKARELVDMVLAEFDGCDVELQFGGQPIYSYVVSAE
jgi:hypothetical protein